MCSALSIQMPARPAQLARSLQFKRRKKKGGGGGGVERGATEGSIALALVCEDFVKDFVTAHC